MLEQGQLDLKHGAGVCDCTGTALVLICRLITRHFSGSTKTPSRCREASC